LKRKELRAEAADRAQAMIALAAHGDARALHQAIISIADGDGPTGLLIDALATRAGLLIRMLADSRGLPVDHVLGSLDTTATSPGAVGSNEELDLR
jgi:hypothetical protein